LKTPFYFAAGVSLVGVLCSWLFLKETNGDKSDRSAGERYAAIFMSLATILRKPIIGTAIFTGFLLTMAQFTMIIGFQTFSVDIAKISNRTMGIFFAVFGIAGILAQLVVPLITKRFRKPMILAISTLLCLAAMFITGFTVEFLPFAISLIVYSLFNGLRNPMLNAIIAEHNDPKQQGRVLGINQSYVSIGQVLGPVIAGLAIVVSIHAVFFLASLYILIALFFAFRLSRKIKN
jgi:predicted MFS family arabinose efflux permease